MSGVFEDWRADLRRYRRSEWLTEPAVWALTSYRFGRWALTLGRGPREVMSLLYAVLRLATRIASNVDIPRNARVGPGLKIFHTGPIVVHPGAVIGANCVLLHGVTLGLRERPGELPVIEDDVTLGAFAQVLGGVTVGRGAKVGAMSVVIDDVPPGTVAVGAPARIVQPGADGGQRRADARSDRTTPRS
jgi:serine O-acetyltransferase